MKKLYSLIRACMSSDMNLFKIKQKKDNKLSKLLPLFISLCFMFAIWTYANMFFEKMAPMHLQFIVLSMFAFLIAILIIVEGIYKAGPLLFNCKDDQLLLSLPIKRSTVLFVRIFKFYVFELLYNTLFVLPLSVAYIRWAEMIDWTYYLVTIIMIFILPIIPIVISCIIGSITSSLSGRFKYKNLAQTVISMIFILGVMYISMNLDKIVEYITQNAKSVNEVITKIYYPAGMYANLVTNFNVKDLLIFIGVNIGLFILMILILSKFYFKINSRLKKVTTHKSSKNTPLKYNSKSVTRSLVKKELNTFFQTPVFIINAGLGVAMYIIFALIVCFKLEDILSGMENSKALLDNISIIIFGIMAVSSFMTSITSSMISLEGKSINILKSLPVSPKKILLSKIIASSILTIPVFILGDILLFIRFNPPIIDMLLILILSIITPLIPHFLGIIVNLKYPKLDFENPAEAVKQSSSSFISVTFGFIMLAANAGVIKILIDVVNTTLLLLIITAVYLLIDIILYLILKTIGVKEFNKLSV